MHGIVGFTGKQQAVPILLEGLKSLEYRGDDSAGIAVRDGRKSARIIKTTGKLKNLVKKIEQETAISGTCGIGHAMGSTHVCNT